MKKTKTPKWRMVTANPPWTPFDACVIPEGADASMLLGSPVAVFRNSRYQVWVYEQDSTAWGPVTQLSIKRNDREPIHDWRDMQRIKNELTDPRREAIEIYPAEARLVDTANQYHLWVLALGNVLPIGFHDGRVVSDKPALQAKQRPFDHVVRDQIDLPETIEEMKKMSPALTGVRARYEEFLASLPQTGGSDG